MLMYYNHTAEYQKQTYSSHPNLQYSCDLFFHNPPHLIYVFHLRVWLDQVTRTAIARIFTKYPFDLMAFDVGSAALIALFKLHFLPATTSILDILRQAHFHLIGKKRLVGLGYGDTCLLTFCSVAK